jgi:hypothetical protein
MRKYLGPPPRPLVQIRRGIARTSDNCSCTPFSLSLLPSFAHRLGIASAGRISLISSDRYANDLFRIPNQCARLPSKSLPRVQVWMPWKISRIFVTAPGTTPTWRPY